MLPRGPERWTLGISQTRGDQPAGVGTFLPRAILRNSDLPKDNTCVLCDACFRSSNHQGHEVHRAAPGGCCDCGDPEAWVAEVGRSTERLGRRGGSLASLPPGLRQAGGCRGSGKVCRRRCRRRGRARTLQLEPGLLDDGTERGDGLVDRPSAAAQSRDEDQGVRVRLHDDDVRPYDDVIAWPVSVSVARAAI